MKDYEHRAGPDLETFVGNLTNEETIALLKITIVNLTDDAVITALETALNHDVKEELGARWFSS